MIRGDACDVLPHNLVGARMVLRSEQSPYDCEPLRGDGNPPLTTPRDELAESLN